MEGRRCRERERDRQTDRQRDRQTERQRLRQIQRQRERQREKMPSTTSSHCRRLNSLKVTHDAFIGPTTQDES